MIRLRTIRSILRRQGAAQPTFLFRNAHSVAASNHIKDEVLFLQDNATGIAALNRRHENNALTVSMIERLMDQYKKWDNKKDVHLVLLKGSGKVFCTGVDFSCINSWKRQGAHSRAYDLFTKQYLFAYILSSYKKPHVALMDGLIYNGGSFSLHSSFRVVTEKCFFAIPAVAGGFHPDAGASHLLSGLPGFIGEYLALTGERLDAAEMLHYKLATHFVPSHRLSLLEERLRTLEIQFPRSPYFDVIRNAIVEYTDYVKPDSNGIIERGPMIDKCFSKETVEDILKALEDELGVSPQKEWIQRTINCIAKASPISLKVALTSVRMGRQSLLSDSLAREYCITSHAVLGDVSGDLYEGYRAFALQHDRKPQWDPSTLAKATNAMVDKYLTQLQEEGWEDWTLPI